MTYQVFNIYTNKAICEPVNLTIAYLIVMWANNNLRGRYETRSVS